MEKQRILVVDDESDICQILKFNLENEGYDVETVNSAEEAEKLNVNDFDLILLDVMMSGKSGHEFANELRKKGESIPIIFITAKDSENDLLTGFSIGADDYIAKPFSIKEIIVRIRAVLKRTSSDDVKKEIFKCDLFDEVLQIDFDKKIVLIADSEIILTKKEYEILSLLVQNKSHYFSRLDILNSVWDSNEYVLDRTIDVHIARLRKKLGNYGSCIVNRSGYGYAFKS